jgi:hypothetical protein
VEESEGVQNGEKVSCVFCGAKRGQSASNGDWIAGQKFGKWYHKLCTKTQGCKQFICGKCL